jgi:hypothetical protein
MNEYALVEEYMELQRNLDKVAKINLYVNDPSRRN